MVLSSLLAEQVEALRDTLVLCVGDIMLDRFITGSVDRISPEAPIPVLRIERETEMLGGAGNVVRNLAALGSRSAFISVLGDDTPGERLRALAEDLPQLLPGLVIEPGRRTTVKTRFFAGVQQLLRADHETLTEVTSASQAQILDWVAEFLPLAGAVVLSDYGKGVLTPNLIQTIIQWAREANKPVIVDPKGNDYERYRGASFLTPNRKELREATLLPVDHDAAITTAARHLISTCGVEGVLVTRSQEGMTLVQGTEAPEHLPAQAREVFDVSGAGDTVVAALAACLAAGSKPLEAAQIANTAAGIVVGKVGTNVAYAAEVTAALHHGRLLSAENKVLDRFTAAETIERWRRKGWKIGFTNGCFDLLHPGHISLLTQARNACDKLVVGINADASVARLKGPTRPIQTETARSTVLASLASVDLVVVFGEDTPLELIRLLKPDVLVKGADYTLSTVVGAAEVMSWGGKIILAALVEGQSTTATLRRIGP